MTPEYFIAGVIVFVFGVFFLVFNRKVSEGAIWLYKRIYTMRVLTVFYKILGIILIIAGLMLMIYGWANLDSFEYILYILYKI